jgi:hypothetical protein
LTSNGAVAHERKFPLSDHSSCLRGLNRRRFLSATGLRVITASSDIGAAVHS